MSLRGLASCRNEGILKDIVTLAWSTHQKKSIDLLGIRCCNKNPGTQKVLKCSTQKLGSNYFVIQG